MPWTAEEFRRKHNKKLKGRPGEKAARLANSLLGRGYSDASAIRIANAAAKKGRK